MGVPWKEGKRMVSNEEYDLRWNVIMGKIKISVKEFRKRIREIRERTGKP